MRVWLCLLSLGITPCLCDDTYVDSVIDLRTKYRKFLPDILTDIPDPPDELSEELNLTNVYEKYQKAGYNPDNWSKKDSLDDPAISESKREWLRRVNPKVKNEFSWEYNSSDSEFQKYQKSVERRIWLEGNTTDVFEDDISDLWDMYMANRTLPPEFPLAFSPPFMFQKYREYSLAYHNITMPTTEHWLLGPLTGDDGVQYDLALERLKKYNISKRDPEKVAAADRFLDNDMKGRKLNKSKDIVRYFIDLRRRLGVTLNWTQPTISISRELKAMDVIDTEEILKKVDKDQPSSSEMDPPDVEADLRKTPAEYLSSEERRQTTTGTTHDLTRMKQVTTQVEKITLSTWFRYEFNTYHRPAVKSTKDNDNFNDGIESTTKNSDLKSAKKTEKGSIRTAKVTTAEVHTKAPETSTAHKPVPSNTPKLEDFQMQQHLSSNKYHSSPTKSGIHEFEDKYRNHTAVKFLQKHKNKFLLGGIACLVAAKVFGS